MKIIIEADSKEIAALVSELQERRRWELFESPVIYRGLSEQGVAGVFGCQNTGSKGSLIENHGGGAGLMQSCVDRLLCSCCALVIDG